MFLRTIFLWDNAPLRQCSLETKYFVIPPPCVEVAVIPCSEEEYEYEYEDESSLSPEDLQAWAEEEERLLARVHQLLLTPRFRQLLADL